MYFEIWILAFTYRYLQIGAGPTGLALALTLLQNGIRPRIINKELKHRVGQRGSGIHVRLVFTLAVQLFIKAQTPSRPGP